MTTQERIVKSKMSLIELAEYLNNVSETCKTHGVSRQHGSVNSFVLLFAAERS